MLWLRHFQAFFLLYPLYAVLCFWRFFFWFCCFWKDIGRFRRSLWLGLCLRFYLLHRLLFRLLDWLLHRLLLWLDLHIHHVIVIDVDLRNDRLWHLWREWLLCFFRLFSLGLFCRHRHRFLLFKRMLCFRHFLFGSLLGTVLDLCLFFYGTAGCRDFDLHSGHDHIRVGQLGVHVLQLFKIDAIFFGDFPERITFLYDMNLHASFPSSGISLYIL